MDVTTLRFNDAGSVHLAVEGVHLAPGAGRLQLVIDTRARCDFAVTNQPVLAMLEGSLSLDSPQHAYIGNLNAHAVALFEFDSALSLRVDTSVDQLLCLDELITPGDLRLRLELTLTLLMPPAGVHGQRTEQLAIRSAVATWGNLLDSAGIETAVTLRLRGPLPHDADQPGGETRPSMGQALARLRQAQAALADHNWEGCVAACRLVLDNAEQLLGYPAVRAAAQSHPPRQRDLSKQDRWHKALTAVRTVCHPAHHDDPYSAEVRWTRADAEAVLACAAALVKLASRPQ